MGAKRQESKADQEVADYLVGCGYEVSARTARVWRAYGLLPRARRLPQGYARTVVSENEPGTFERAEVVARARGGQRTSLDDLVLTLFFEEEEVPLILLQLALRRTLVKAHREITMVIGKVDDAADIQEQIQKFLSKIKKPRSKVARFLLGGVDEMLTSMNVEFRESPEALISSALTVLIAILLGVDVGELATGSLQGRDPLDEMIDAFKINRLLEGGSAPSEATEKENREKLRQFILSIADDMALLPLAESALAYSMDEYRQMRQFCQDASVIAHTSPRNDRRLHLNSPASARQVMEKLGNQLLEQSFELLFTGKIAKQLTDTERDELAERLRASRQSEEDVEQLLNATTPQIHRILGSGGDFSNFPQKSIDRLQQTLIELEENDPELVARVRDRQYESEV